MYLNKENNKFINKLLIAGSIIFAINFWSSISIGLSPYTSNLPVLVLFIYIIIVISSKNHSNYYISEMQSIMKWTIITIYISILAAFIEYRQELQTTFVACTRLSYGLFIYYILKKWNTSEKTLISILTPICIIWVFIEIGQQFTYPNYWFAGRNEEWGIENRMGLWRFYIWGVDFVMMIMCYWAANIAVNNKFSLKSLLIALILIIGLLCYCSRKHIYCVFVAIGYIFINMKGKYKNLIRFILICLVSYIFISYYDSYKEMSDASNELQGEGEDFIRLLEAKYFLFDHSDSFLYPIWGSGIHGGESLLSKKIQDLTELYGFYQADVGLIGYYSQFGLLGVSAIIAYIYKFIKNWKYIDLWLKCFFIMKIMLIIFDFWGMWAVGMMAYAIFLHITDLNIYKNKLAARI